MAPGCGTRSGSTKSLLRVAGPLNTPTAERLAPGALKYNRFHFHSRRP
jgi:hypothetical protein